MNLRRIIFAIAFCVTYQSAFAADFRVPKKEWDGLTAEQRAAIEKNLIENRLLLQGDRIVGVEGANVGAWNPVCDLRRAACDVAAAAAAASCSGAPPVVAICLLAVAAARDECRKC